jgi:hypothetical protein
MRNATPALCRFAMIGAMVLFLAPGLAGMTASALERTKSVPVTVDNFIRAETDLYFSKAEFGKLRHTRQMAPIDMQEVVRMNRDTLYSSGVFDLQAAPLTIALPDSGKRFMSMQVIDQDHYTIEVIYTPGSHSYTKERVGTRYVYIIIRTLADPKKPDDVRAANALQDAIKVEQANQASLNFRTGIRLPGTRSAIS